MKSEKWLKLNAGSRQTILATEHAGIKNYELYENHHTHGAELAERILKEFNCPEAKSIIQDKYEAAKILLKE